jgi:hypothetical protein
VPASDQGAVLGDESDDVDVLDVSDDVDAGADEPESPFDEVEVEVDDDVDVVLDLPRLSVL